VVISLLEHFTSSVLLCCCFFVMVHILMIYLCRILVVTVRAMITGYVPQGGRADEQNSRTAFIITAGLATAAGASGLGAAVYLADRYGLVPPDHAGIVGSGKR